MPPNTLKIFSGAPETYFLSGEETPKQCLKPGKVRAPVCKGWLGWWKTGAPFTWHDEHDSQALKGKPNLQFLFVQRMGKVLWMHWASVIVSEVFSGFIVIFIIVIFIRWTFYQWLLGDLVTCFLWPVCPQKCVVCYSDAVHIYSTVSPNISVPGLVIQHFGNFPGCQA